MQMLIWAWWDNKRDCKHPLNKIYTIFHSHSMYKNTAHLHSTTYLQFIYLGTSFAGSICNLTFIHVKTVFAMIYWLTDILIKLFVSETPLFYFYVYTKQWIKSTLCRATQTEKNTFVHEIDHCFSSYQLVWNSCMTPGSMTTLTTYPLLRQS